MKRDLQRGPRPTHAGKKKRRRQPRKPNASMPWSDSLPSVKKPNEKGKKRSKSNKKGAELLRKPHGKSKRRSCV